MIHQADHRRAAQVRLQFAVGKQTRADDFELFLLRGVGLKPGGDRGQRHRLLHFVY